MVIGISGKLGSGKDTVGLAIQTLMDNDLTREERLEILEGKLAFPPDYHPDGWQIKKMAGKLKEIASIILGVPVEKFEDRAFKESKLGPEWGYILRDDGRICSPDEMPDEEYTEMTVREFLQRLGTDAMRNGLHPDTWANAFWADYTKHQRYERGFEEVGIMDPTTGESGIALVSKVEWDYPNWIITDVRFPNEAQSVLDHGGILIRVTRGGDTGNHPSETGLDDWDFEYLIDNNGTYEELLFQVQQILNREQL